MSFVRVAARVFDWRTAVVWTIAALATALAVSSISAAGERDRALRIAERQSATVEIGTERRLEIERLLDVTRQQLATAARERAELLEELAELRVALERAAQSPSPGRFGSGLPG